MLIVLRVFSPIVRVELDNELNRKIHVAEQINQKLNLLKSLYFLPTTVRADFYLKVIN